MAEFTSNAIQVVTQNQNVIFTDNIISSNSCITHRNDSGLINVKGMTNQRRARYKAFFSGNIAIPATGTVAPISLTIALDGEPISSSSMIRTSSTTGALNNVATEIVIDVPRGCCATISVKNTSTQAINVQNANLIVERVS